jgi:hypothetical protein
MAPLKHCQWVLASNENPVNQSMAPLKHCQSCTAGITSHLYKPTALHLFNGQISVFKLCIGMYMWNLNVYLKFIIYIHFGNLSILFNLTVTIHIIFVFIFIILPIDH